MVTPFPEYETFDAVGLRGLVAAGQIRPRDVVAAAIDRMERRNPALNAVVRIDGERALRLAEDVVRDDPRPFAGVPFLVKDLELIAGDITTFGSVFFRSYVADVTTTLAGRMQASGLLSIGRTNTPEFGLLPTTEPVLFGRTANPWDLSRSPGGSSGGSAAAVAAGIVPIASGGDGGGSIRIPASCCGLFGLKTSRGLMPQFPPGASDHLAVGGCLSRSVRDTAVFLDATSGSVPGSRFTTPKPPRPFRAALSEELRPLRIGLWTSDLRGDPLHADCAAAVREAAELAESVGHDVEEMTPDLDADQLEDAFLVVWEALAAFVFELVLAEMERRAVGRWTRRLLGDWRTMRLIARLDQRKSGLEAFEPFTWDLVDRSRRRTPAALAMAETALAQASFALAEAMDGRDLLLTPTLGRPPVMTGELDQDTGIDELERALRSYVPYTPLANFSGRPAMSVPLHWNDDGLPIGVQFMGNLGDDFTLIQLAAQLERARPWFGRLPPVAEREGIEPPAANHS